MVSNIQNKSENITVPSDAVAFIRDALTELKADNKDLSKRIDDVQLKLVDIEKQLIHQKWKNIMLGMAGGGVAGVGIMKTKFLELIFGP